jgi:hypothetical protein
MKIAMFGHVFCVDESPRRPRRPHDVSGILRIQAGDEHHRRTFEVGLHGQAFIECRLRVTGPPVLVDYIKGKALRPSLARELVTLLGGMTATGNDDVTALNLKHQGKHGGLATTAILHPNNVWLPITQ